MNFIGLEAANSRHGTKESSKAVISADLRKEANDIGASANQANLTRGWDEDPKIIPQEEYFYMQENTIFGNGAADGYKPGATPPSSALKNIKDVHSTFAVDQWTLDQYNPSQQAPKTNFYLVPSHGEQKNTDTKNYSKCSRCQGPLVKQPAMEFRQKYRANSQSGMGFNNRSSGSNLSSGLQANRNQISAAHPGIQNAIALSNEQKYEPAQKPLLPHTNKGLNKMKEDQGFTNPVQKSWQMNYLTQQQQVAQQHSLTTLSPIPMANTLNSGQLQHKFHTWNQNLLQRWQELLQNRNDPSHVGSVQMESLTSRNQLLAKRNFRNSMLRGSKF